MKPCTLVCLCALSAALATPAVHAKGCVKGAAVGAVAGHVAGHHAVVGAVTGCLVGHHLAKKHAAEEKARAEATAPPQGAHDRPPVAAHR